MRGLDLRASWHIRPDPREGICDARYVDLTDSLKLAL